MRQQQTYVEKILWSKLRDRQLVGFKFRRQVPIGAYIVDFYCHEQRLVVELDGSQHLVQQEYDVIRTDFLQANGLRGLRFWNNQIIEHLDEVLDLIIKLPPPTNG